MANQTIHALLVEDKTGNLGLMNDLVSKESSIRFTWEHVATLSDAKNLLREVPFDIVLLDLSLSDSQGLDTFIHLHPHAVCLPVVVVSNLDDELLAMEAVRAGAQDYLIREKANGEALVRLRFAIERNRIEIALRARNQQLSVVTEQLWQKARLALAVDELIGRLIRELNNPLAAVSVELSDLLTKFAPNDPERASLQTIQVEVERLGQLVASLMQASLQNMDQPSAELPDLLQYLQTQEGPSLERQEKNFFEALGAWVAGYMLKSAAVTPRGLKNYLKRLERSGSVVYEPLSHREREVVRLVAAGYTNKQIAKRLSLSVRTVERHTSSIMNKLGLQNRAELIAYAVRTGIINGDDLRGSNRKNDAT